MANPSVDSPPLASTGCRGQAMTRYASAGGMSVAFPCDDDEDRSPNLRARTAMRDRKLARGKRRLSHGEPDGDAHADSDVDANPFADSDANPDSEPLTYAIAHVHPAGHGYRYRHAHGHTLSDVYAHTDRRSIDHRHHFIDPDANAHSDAVDDQHPHTDAHTYSDRGSIHYDDAACPHTDENGNAVGDAHAHANTQSHAHRHGDDEIDEHPITHAHADTNAHGDAYRHRHQHKDANCDTDADAYVDGDAYSDGHPNTDAKRDTHVDSDSDVRWFPRLEP